MYGVSTHRFPPPSMLFFSCDEKATAEKKTYLYGHQTHTSIIHPSSSTHKHTQSRVLAQNQEKNRKMSFFPIVLIIVSVLAVSGETLNGSGLSPPNYQIQTNLNSQAASHNNQYVIGQPSPSASIQICRVCRLCCVNAPAPSGKNSLTIVSGKFNGGSSSGTINGASTGRGVGTGVQTSSNTIGGSSAGTFVVTGSGSSTSQKEQTIQTQQGSSYGSQIIIGGRGVLSPNHIKTNYGSNIPNGFHGKYQGYGNGYNYYVTQKIVPTTTTPSIEIITVPPPPPPPSPTRPCIPPAVETTTTTTTTTTIPTPTTPVYPCSSSTPAVISSYATSPLYPTPPPTTTTTTTTRSEYVTPPEQIDSYPTAPPAYPLAPNPYYPTVSVPNVPTTIAVPTTPPTVPQSGSCCFVHIQDIRAIVSCGKKCCQSQSTCQNVRNTTVIVQRNLSALTAKVTIGCDEALRLGIIKVTDIPTTCSHNQNSYGGYPTPPAAPASTIAPPPPTPTESVTSNENGSSSTSFISVFVAFIFSTLLCF